MRLTSALFLVLALAMCGGKQAPESASGAAPREKPGGRGGLVSEVVSERVSVVNNLPVPVDVVVVSKAPGRDPIEVRTGLIDAGAQRSATIDVQSGGSFEVTATWMFDGQVRTSNTFTANLLKGYPITPVTMTLGMSFDTPTNAQWKGVEWEPPAGME